MTLKRHVVLTRPRAVAKAALTSLLVALFAVTRVGHSCKNFLNSGTAPERRTARSSVALQATSTADQTKEGGLLTSSTDQPKVGGLFGSVDDSYVDDLFAQYDPDGSGTIDRDEFWALAQRIKESSSRRTLSTALGAVIAGVLVGGYSQEYQILQGLFRRFYVDYAAETAMNEFFPTAQLAVDVDKNVFKVLSERGLTPSNTLFAHSICPDELNSKSEELVALMQATWGEAFSLGGLAGIPFAGKSGFEAFLHHTPEKSGKILILLAPHVGVSTEGLVGRVNREGQSKPSTACGAAVGAFKALERQPLANDVSFVGGAYDTQFEFIKSKLSPLLNGIENSQDQMAYVSYQNFNVARDLMISTITSVVDIYDWCDEVVVLGGLMVNRKIGGDFFQPLLFETRMKNGTTSDLFIDAFGARPNLATILGSEAKSRQVLFGDYGR